MTKDRELFIDYAKAIGVFLVVCFHTGISSINNIVYIIMTLFFFTSGYTARYENKSMRQNIKKLFSKILIPFWIAMLFYGIFEIFRAQYLGYGKADIFLPAMIGLIYGTSQKVPLIPYISSKVVEIMSYKPRGTEFLNVMLPTNCHLWFLPAFFTGAVMFILYLNSAGKKRKFIIDAFSVIVLLILASIESFESNVQLPYCIGRGFYSCACMIAGRICRDHEFFNKLNANAKKAIFTGMLLLVISVGAYFLGASRSALVRSEYGPHGIFAPMIVYAGGISAVVLLLQIIKAVTGRHVFAAAAYIGQHSMPVYLWHMFFLNVISVLILKITGIELAQDIWFMAIIPESHTGLIILTAVLSVLCCAGIDLLVKNYLNKVKSSHCEHLH